MTDAGLPALVLSTLRRAGWWCERLQAGTARGGRVHMARAGAPDIVAIRPRMKLDDIGWHESAKPVLIECKRKDGLMRKGQTKLMLWCLERGIEYVVVRCVDDIAAIVERRG